MSIPIIDFGNFDEQSTEIARHVFDACTTIGFFYVTGHGIPKDDIDRAFALSEDYFKLPEEEKGRYCIEKDNHGYSGLGSEKLDPEHQRQGDYKEGFNFRNFIHGKPFAPLPEPFASHVDFVEHFSRSCHQVAMRVLEAFAVALNIPKDWFQQRHRYDETSGEVLRFLKYPRGTADAEGCTDVIRAGAHSDYGSITLLFQKDIPGLEVQASRTNWIAVPYIPNAVLVNIGDLLEFWTNGLFRSTMHRVVFMPEHQSVDRYSIPFFVHPQDNVQLEPIPSQKIPPPTEPSAGSPLLTAGEHLAARLDATYQFQPKK